MRTNYKILVIVFCLAALFSFGAKSTLSQRLENIERTVEALNKRVNYLERRLRVNRTVIPGHETYYGDDPVHTAVSGEDLITYHRAIEEAERKRRTRRPRRGRATKTRQKHLAISVD